MDAENGANNNGILSLMFPMTTPGSIVRSSILSQLYLNLETMTVELDVKDEAVGIGALQVAVP
jgi:hypothetical protein